MNGSHILFLQKRKYNYREQSFLTRPVPTVRKTQLNISANEHFQAVMLGKLFDQLQFPNVHLSAHLTLNKLLNTIVYCLHGSC